MLKKLADAIPDALNAVVGATDLSKSGGARAILDIAWRGMEGRLAKQGHEDSAFLRRRAEQSFELGLKICESPIERAILPVLICGDYGDAMDAPLRLCHASDLLPEENIVLVPQLPFVKYRLDFALVIRAKGAIKIVAVECDGIQYHKENHIIRDGFLASWGVKTLHFDGKQIMSNPFSISARVSDAVQDALV